MSDSLPFVLLTVYTAVFVHSTVTFCRRRVAVVEVALEEEARLAVVLLFSGLVGEDEVLLAVVAVDIVLV